MSWLLVDENTDCPIKPSDIDASRHFGEAFDHFETGTAAQDIVKMCQAKGTWFAFTFEEIEDFFHLSCPEAVVFLFYRLTSPGFYFMPGDGWIPFGGKWVVLGEDEKYRVTDEFILKCYGQSVRSIINDVVNNRPE